MASPTLTLEEAHKKVRDDGVLVRNELLGNAFLESAAARGPPTPFLEAGLDMISEIAFGTIWTRPGLERKQRSLITITLLATLGRSSELQIHTAIGRRNGLTEDEIKECLLQVMVYAGVPAGFEAFRVADEALKVYKP